LLPYLIALLDLSGLQHRSTSRLPQGDWTDKHSTPADWTNQTRQAKMVVYKLVVLGGADVGKTALTLQVRPFLYLHIPDQSLTSNS
jgi:polynucleotide 5'-kinase involved in rRNA processing